MLITPSAMIIPIDFILYLLIAKVSDKNCANFDPDTVGIIVFNV
ncbi:MAG: hypothetical protein SGI87_06625 [Flavobacteriales bacterium]|nr:hypothetical protein [Flavobacteriales bacterium]